MGARLVGVGLAGVRVVGVRLVGIVALSGWLAGCGSVLSRVTPAPVTVTDGPGTVSARARYQYLVGRLAIEEGSWEDAEDALKTALLHDAGSPWIWLSLADVSYGAGEELEERRRVHEAVRVGPELAATWSRLGALEARTGDMHAALEAWQEAVDRGAGSESWLPLCRELVRRQDPLAPATVRAWGERVVVDPDMLRERGHLRLQVGDLPGAVADLGEVILRDPDDARLLDEYLIAVTGSGLYRQGLAHLVTLHRLAPRDSDVLLRTYHLAALARDQVRAAEALEALDLLLGGHEAQVKLWLADAYSQLGRHQEAEAAVLSGSACAPPLADAGFHHARVLRAAGRSGAALEALVLPASGANRADAIALRARLLVDIGHGAEARAVVEAALVALPDDYVLLGALVSVHGARGDREAMLAAVDRMAMLDTEARARTRARSLAGLSDLEGALAALRATELAQPETWAVGGGLLREAGRVDDAVEWLARGVDRFPRNASLRAELGLAEAAADQGDAALVAMREALQLDPGEARAARFYAGAVTASAPVDRLRQARGYLLAALERQPADAELLGSLGQIERALGQPLRAVEAWEEARRYGASDPALLTALADTYRSVGRVEAADDLMELLQP